METVGQLAGGIAHDMNNLLIAIMGNAELVCSSLDGEQLDRDMMREDLEQVLLAGNRAAALTNQLLTFSRRKIIRTRPIQLGEVALALQELLRRLIRENIALEVDVSPGLPSVKADTSMMNQVVLNLVMNARDAIEGPGEIRIRVQNLPEDRVALSVTDSGCGMTDEERERATELFFTTKHLGAGTGLGLATVKRIINQSSGELRIESTPGEGSTFTVLLPAFHGPASPVDEDRTGGTEGGSETLLVCEDDLVVLEFIRRALEPEGYVVLSANTASIASEKAASSPRLDLLLTDIVLPQSSGPEVAARLQVHHPDLGVIFMSGYGGTDLGGAIQDDVAFLQKPFNKASLLRTVRDVLNARAR